MKLYVDACVRTVPGKFIYSWFALNDITFDTRFTVEKTCLFRCWRGCRVGARSLGGKYNLEQEEDDRLLYRLLEMITVLSFFHCQRVGGLVLGASEENTI